MSQQTPISNATSPGLPFAPISPRPDETHGSPHHLLAGIGEPADGKVVLTGISWPTYEAILRELDNPGTRLTYDCGNLTIMSPTRRHEYIKALLRRMFEITCEEFGIDFTSGGATTHKSERIRKGFEPDECFFIQHEAEMTGRDEWRAGVDPPPDLAIEVDIHSRSDEKLAVYAAFGVPEIWHWYDGGLHVLQLQANQTYTEAARSAAVPQADLKLIESIVLRQNARESVLMREFRNAIRR